MADLSHPDLPECFQQQTLRQFIFSYTSIAMSHQTTSRADHTTGTKGVITDPERRLAPESIEPWTAADREQEHGMIAVLLREVDRVGADHFAFPARYYSDCVGEDLGRLDSEHALLNFDNDTLHKPATRILRALLASDRIRTALARRQQQPGHHRQYRPGTVSFTTHLNRFRPQYVFTLKSRFAHANAHVYTVPAGNENATPLSLPPCWDLPTSFASSNPTSFPLPMTTSTSPPVRQRCPRIHQSCYF